MVRTQIQLTEEQASFLKASAAREGVSMAEFIRKLAVGAMTNRGARSDREVRQRAVRAAGRFRSGHSNVAANHDAYLSEDFAR